MVRFDVKVDTSRDNYLSIRGNPYLTGVSVPAGKEFNYHSITFSPTIGSDSNLTFEIAQRRKPQKVQESDTTSETDVKLKAVANEAGSTGEMTAETGFIESLFAELSFKASVTAKETVTDSTSTGTGEGHTRTLEYTVMVPARRLVYKQKGQPASELNLDE